MKIADFLLQGEANAIPRRTLESMTGWNGREIRLEIQRERLEGVPIIGGQSGYFLAETQREKQAFVSSMRHRAGEIMRAAAAVEGVQMDGETEIFR